MMAAWLLVFRPQVGLVAVRAELSSLWFVQDVVPGRNRIKQRHQSDDVRKVVVSKI